MSHRTSSALCLTVGFAVLAGVCVPAFAEEQKSPPCPICSKTTDDQASYPTKAGLTLVRGTANTLLGWTELIRQPANEVKSGGNVLTGLAHGVGESVKRTAAGLAEVLTFWTPKVKGHYLHAARNCPICMKGR